MEHRNHTLHRLPVLKSGGDVIDNDKRKNLKGKHENNIIYKDVNKNIKKHEPETEKADVKNPKYMLRREKPSLKNLKETLSACSGYAKRLIRSSHTNCGRKYSKKRTPSRRTNRIKLLISPKARKLKKKRTNINQELIKDIYDLNFNSPCNTLKNTCNISCINIKNKQNLNYCKVQKKGKRQNNSKDHALDKLNCNKLSKLSSKSSNVVQPMFRLVKFPDYDQTDTEIEAINMAQNNVLDNCQYKCEETPSTEKEIEDTASKPCCSNTQGGGGDACNIGIQCSALTNKGVQREKIEELPKLSKNNLQCSDTLLDPLDISKHVLFLAKRTVKYFVIGLVFIVWSPCIVTLYFCWLVTYFLRPKYRNSPGHSSRCRKQSQVKILQDGKQMADNLAQTNRNNTWSILSNCFCLTHQPIAASFRAFKELLSSGNDNIQSNQSLTNKCSDNKQRIITSDPEKKYTLYYNKNKGWVMKCKKLREIKEVPKRTCQKCNRNRICDTNTVDKSRSAQCSCRGHEGKYLIKNATKSLQPSCRCNSCKHLCTDKSSVLIHSESLNPMYKGKCSCPKHGPNVRSHKSKSCPLIPLRSKERLYRKCSSCRRITKKTSPLKLQDKIWRYCKKKKCNIKSLICDIDTTAFGEDVCRANYMYTRKRQWDYIHKNCPSFYPVCLDISKFYKNLCHYCLLLLAGCIWCPLLACCYLCYKIICKCF